jgi:hypothetical protein
MGELVGGEFVSWPAPDSFGRNRNPTGIRRNPKESRVIRWKYTNSCPAGIPAKKTCKSGRKQEFSRPLKNHVPVNNFLWEKMGKNLSKPVFFCFLVLS